MMLEIRDLTVSYGMHRALAGVSAQVDKGEIVVVLGANGAGKSTLLRAVAGLCEGDVAGDVRFGDQGLSGLGPDEIVEAGVALVPEGRGIFGDLTVQENLSLGAYAGRARKREKENLNRVLALFPRLRERSGQIARTMSGGEQQMVAIGRAMMSEPEILMLDEPSLGLSPLLCKELFQNLARVRDTGIGVLLVEQNARQSLTIADRGYLLENGEIIGANSAEAMLRDPAVQAAYLGGGASTSLKTPQKTTPRHPPQKPVTTAKPSSDALAGGSINDLVARAAEAQSAHVMAQRAAPAPTTPVPSAPLPTGLAIDAPPSSDSRVQTILKDIEEAAAAARSGHRSAAPLARSSVRDLPVSSRSPDRSTDKREDPAPVIEVYRRPRVEVYRRGDNGFERV